jgi:isochorismate synthase/2-succinyl-5-enolpyruvyl-6-hydroxy-3-cyclohexene-1-carboxylate synthase/2-succinyl-6-hydroxy-2,4-cyclohexadiene-1-carboxylate synthase/O-succinylbenzoate synthase
VAAQAVAADLLTFRWDEPQPEVPAGDQEQQQQRHEDGPTPSSSSSYDPVCLTRTITLPTITSWPAAAAALSAALQQQAAPLASLPAACLRVEVGLPLQRSTSALRWLLGQPGAGTHQVYFSQRHSTAPDTPGAVAAAAASAAWTSLAGHGAAWEWRGVAGAELGGAAVSSCRRFLSESSPAVRVLGGGRFDPQQAPAPEWASFGSYCFVLPQLEVTEADQVLLLAVTVAWDGR